MKALITTLSFFLILTSCSTVRVVKYQNLPNEKYATNNLKVFLQECAKNGRNPRIVLKVPNSNDKATSNTVNSPDYNVLYNAIEKEFVRNGYTVRDRGLFNEIMDKSKSTDYSKFGEETNTDLILELININTNVHYSTNKLTALNNDNNTIIQPTDYKRLGATVEFRLIIIKNNEIAGNYKFNYTPCITGCSLDDWTYNKRSKQLELRETVEVNYLEGFITKSTKDLIDSFKE